MSDDKKNSIAHLIDAGTSLLEEEGVAGVTVRAVAARAGLSFAAVQHHFASKELLLRAIYNEALARDQARLQQFRAALSVPQSGEVALELLQGLLAMTCGAGAPLTAARNAALLGHARRHESYGDTRRWHALRRAVLTQMVRAVVPRPRAAARFLHELILGIELFSLGCRAHPLVPLLNSELLRYGFAVVCGRQQPYSSPWFERSVVDALGRDEVLLDGQAPAPNRKSGARRKILEAGARLLAERGAMELSHRSVAKEAGVALSVLSYHFRTADDLVYGIYRFVQNQTTAYMIERERSRGARKITLASAGIELQMGAVPAYLASLEAVVAGAHNRQLANFAWTTRMTRGVYYFYQITRSYNSIGPAAFNVHVYSIWTAGVTLLAEATWQRRRIGPLLKARMEQANILFPTDLPPMEEVPSLDEESH